MLLWPILGSVFNRKHRVTCVLEIKPLSQL